MTPRISFSTLACPDWSLDSIIQCAADLGYDGIELRASGVTGPMWNHPELAGSALLNTRARLRNVGLAISCVDTIRPLDQVDRSDRIRAIAEAERSLSLAAAVGAPAIRVFGAASAPEDAADMRMIESLSMLVEKAANLDIAVRLAAGGPVAQAARAARTIQHVGSPRLGMLWDPTTAFIESATTRDEVIGWLKSAIRHLELSDVRPEYELSRVLSLFRSVAPHGWICINADAAREPGTVRWITDQLRGRSLQPSTEVVRVEMSGRLRVDIHPDRDGMGAAAAEAVAQHLREAIAKDGGASIILASAPSQNEFLLALRHAPAVDWSRITAFHLDEYLGISPDHPASFRRFLIDRLVGHVPVRAFHGLDGTTADPAAECARYSALLYEHAPSLAILGIGENGHLAFIDPPVCDFVDPATVRVVELDAACRTQQVHDGCFEQLDLVPTHALSLTIPYLMQIPRAVAIVPGERKRAAVRGAVLGPLTPNCPASILRRHPDATLFLDRSSGAPLLHRHATVPFPDN